MGPLARILDVRMPVLTAIAAVILAMVPIAASGSSPFQSRAAQQKATERVVVLAVQGMT